MNPPSYEVQLYALAVLLYLIDSSLLLYANEAVLTRTGPARWAISWGASGFLLARRTLSVQSPLTPHRPAFRLRWNFSDDELQRGDDRWNLWAERLRQLSPCVIVAAVALFLILPLGLFSALGVYAIGTSAVLLYGSILYALFRLHRERELLALAGKSFWGFGFECIACPPFGVNMLRRVSLALPVREPLPVAAARLLDAAQWQRVRTECVARVSSALQSAEEGSPEHRALSDHREWLARYPGRA